MCKEKEGVVIVFSDITLRKSAEKQLSRMALYDHLTDLPNRILFEKNAEKSLARAKRNNHLVAIMFLDLDHFKQVNDTLGHDSGDQLLKCVSLRIHSIVRENDTFARLGGDEFAIILEDISTINDCKQVAEKILNAFRVPFTISNHEIIVEISIGISIYPYGGQNISHLIKNADVAMYQAKNKKHSSYKIDDKSMNYPMKKQFQLEIYLHDAIENNELKLYYQPKVNIRKNLISGLEALLRWHHPKLGIISPDTFIPIAEKMGIMPQIAEWTINTACQDIHNLKKQLISNIRVSINLSSSQITYGDISKKLQYSLQQYQISPHDIEIELTETTMIIYRKQCAETLKNLHDIGVTIAIDDFGTGYSSLNYLKDLPIDVLKIDRTFVNDIEYGENSQVIAKAIIDLAHELKLSVVAEGVETLNQVNLLKSYGCDYIQGFYYSKPKSVDQIINYIRHNSQSVF